MRVWYFSCIAQGFDNMLARFALLCRQNFLRLLVHWLTGWSIVRPWELCVLVTDCNWSEHAGSIPNADQCRSIKIRFQELIQNQFYSIKICFELYWVLSSKIDLYWSKLIGNDLYWSTSGSIPEVWSLLISIGDDPAWWLTGSGHGPTLILLCPPRQLY